MEGKFSLGNTVITQNAIVTLHPQDVPIAIYRANYTCNVNGKQELKPEKEWIHTPVEPLISEELWNRCNALIDTRKTGPPRHFQKARPSLRRRRPLHLRQQDVCPFQHPEICLPSLPNKIPIVDLEAVFHEQLKNFFLSPDEIAKYLNEADKTLHHKEEVLDILTKEKQRIAQSMDKVYEFYIDGQIKADGFGSRYKPLEERSKQLDEEIPRLQAEADPPQNQLPLQGSDIHKCTRSLRSLALPGV